MARDARMLATGRRQERDGVRRSLAPIIVNRETYWVCLNSALPICSNCLLSVNDNVCGKRDSHETGEIG